MLLLLKAKACIYVTASESKSMYIELKSLKPC